MFKRPTCIRRISRFLRHERGTALIEFAFTFPVLFLLIFGGIELSRYLVIQHKVQKGVGVISSVVTQETQATTAGAGISQTELNTNVFPNFDNVLGAYSVKNNVSPGDAVIITSIYRLKPGDPEYTDTCAAAGACIMVTWQAGEVTGEGAWFSAITGTEANDSGAMKGLCITNYDNNGVVTSRFCNPPIETGGTLAMDQTEKDNIAAMLPGENMIVTEVFYQYQPILKALLDNVGMTDHLPFDIPASLIARRLYASPRNNGGLRDLPPDFPVQPD